MLGYWRDRTTLKNREKNLALPLLKRQAKAQLEQIARHIEAIDEQGKLLITADATLARKCEMIASIQGLGPITAA
jgi:transposase